jgi:hypothetical protein
VAHHGDSDRQAIDCALLVGRNEGKGKRDCEGTHHQCFARLAIEVTLSSTDGRFIDAVRY